MQLQHESSNNPNFDPIVLVCAADDNYAMPLAVMLRSMLENLENNRKLSLFIIDGGIKEKNKRKIEKSICSNQIKFTWLQAFDETSIDVDELQFYYTKAIYCRLYIPELLPQYGKAIYLDSDLIVLENIGNLWNIDIGNHCVLAARDLFDPPLLSAAYSDYLKVKNSTTPKMFNSGAMVINLEKWRAEEISLKAIECISKYKLLDQEALNTVLEGRWKEIDPGWNQTTGVFEYSSWENSPFSSDEFDRLLNNPKIVHFTSASKPWNSINSHPAQPLFYKYLDMTNWTGWRFTQWKRLFRRLAREINKVSKALLYKQNV